MQSLPAGGRHAEIEHRTDRLCEPAATDELRGGTQQEPSVLWRHCNIGQLNGQASSNQMAFRKSQKGLAN